MGAGIRLPRNGEQQNHTPRGMGAGLGEHQNHAPLGMGSRSGGRQKSWIQTVLDPVLNYGSHKKSQVQIEELSLKDKRRILLGLEAN